ncbi:probable pectinesterase 67 [Selaginella moellendorffii]|uniref:probable pectinesterase 67 n=1 Tax=Selaginella moellendorffii TaxID=88036 RepID=UPI000D1CD847|nr:probable pectinesterase 67 [Selaginella moellendorffii]|eukprot:XP_024536181.1 probable pectinesterase 67 [Selaginella moellendorffii]
MLRVIFLLGLLVLLSQHNLCKGHAEDDLHPALVNANERKIDVYVGPSSDFKTIQAAIDAVPLENKRRYIIHVASGVYRERITIPASKDFITLLGNFDDKFATIVVSAGNEPTLSVQNDAPFVYAGAVEEQQSNTVAVQVSGDFAAFYDCFITSSQHTLSEDRGRHFYKRTFIQGSINFITGQGRSLFQVNMKLKKNCFVRDAYMINSLRAQECNIVSNSRNNTGGITLQSKPERSWGYSFVNSYFGGTGQLSFGHPWKDFARVVLISSYFDEVVIPNNWDRWPYNNGNGNVLFAEYDSQGPGAVPTKLANWVKHLSEEEAQDYSSIAFVDGEEWLFLEV